MSAVETTTVKLPKRKTMRIEFPHQWGGHPRDHRHWCGTVNGEVWDYNSRHALIRQAEKNGFAWKVIRHHRDGSESVVARS